MPAPTSPPSQTPSFTIVPAEIDAAESAAVLRVYFSELCRRYYSRPITDEDVDAAIADEPGADLRPPTGVFLLARQSGVVAGCVGVRWLTAYAELTKMFVLPEFRGTGLAPRLLAAAEDRARSHGSPEMRLGTRLDLVEARGLYRRSGYREIDRYGDDPYAECWFAKPLLPQDD
ncbi:GNAT superfamily N-acetyltransferase [Prauserella isguenensis]|uniref:GNAT superfamily N-acetyltransferase n=1 Tax=Prauserella isguenensis TaxID=1470180 RepID=A0A839S669_9PSEU|nr:GNAT family N-acetyltransferase [Prauserella isguenensis]MBB3052862.1 GNAT superfamily N-acetyltransferase [Prauserella isguenensis]